MTKKLFIASTGKNVGKTTVCLGLLSGLQNHFPKLGFLKPVGQRWVESEDGMRMDKDIAVLKRKFQLDIPSELMSPVLLPQAFTRQYLDGKIDEKILREDIINAFSVIENTCDFTLIEGTGHVGVGSLINLNNAEVAKMLEAPVVLVSPGGIGSTFDQLALNVALCQHHRVSLAGVILNKVLDEKKAMVERYMKKALKKWGLPLLGLVPFHPLLSTPTLKDFESLFQTELIAGLSDRLHHFKTMRMVATSVDVYEKTIASEQLIITHAAREDVILASLARYMNEKEAKRSMKLGLILTGSIPRLPIIRQIKEADLPALVSSLDSFETMQKITSHTAKIAQDDNKKIAEAIQLVTHSLDFDTLIQKL